MSKPSKPMHETRLWNMLQYYVERYDQPLAHVRRHFLRKITLSAREHGTDTATLTVELDRLLGELVASRVIDDARCAERLVRKARSRGASTARIRVLGRQKGLGDTLNEAVATRDPAADEWAAACTLARRRSIGPWRRGADTPEVRKRELGIFGRAGFGYALAKRVLDAAPDELV